MAPGYQPPKRLNVTVLAISQRDDWKEAVDTFTTALRHELKSQGIDASFGSAPPDGPLAELTVTEWEPYSSDHGLDTVVSGEKGHVTIVVGVTNDDGGSSLDGEVRGSWGWNVWTGWLIRLFVGPLDAPRAAARSIAVVIAKGKVVQLSPHSNGL